MNRSFNSEHIPNINVIIDLFQNFYICCSFCVVWLKGEECKYILNRISGSFRHFEKNNWEHQLLRFVQVQFCVLSLHPILVCVWQSINLVLYGLLYLHWKFDQQEMTKMTLLCLLEPSKWNAWTCTSSEKCQRLNK